MFLETVGRTTSSQAIILHYLNKTKLQFSIMHLLHLEGIGLSTDNRVGQLLIKIRDPMDLDHNKTRGQMDSDHRIKDQMDLDHNSLTTMGSDHNNNLTAIKISNSKTVSSNNLSNQMVSSHHPNNFRTKSRQLDKHSAVLAQPHHL